MPVNNYIPTAAGTYQQWSNGAGTVPTNVQTNDGDTTFRTVGGGLGGRDTFAMQDLPGDADTVNSVTLHSILRRSGAGSGSWRLVTRYSGVDAFYGTGFTVNQAYTDHSYLATTPGGGGSWTVAIWNASECGYDRYASGAASCNATMTYASISYELAVGSGFITFYHFLLPLIGGMMTLQSFAPVMGELGRVKEYGIFRPDEIRQAYSEYEAYRRPVHFDLGRRNA